MPTSADTTEENYEYLNKLYEREVERDETNSPQGMLKEIWLKYSQHGL